MNFLSYNSPFMVWFRRTIDYVLLGLLWCLFSLPIITYGAATSAALITAEKSIRQDNGYLLVTFLKYFRQEFRQATGLWLIQLPINLVIGLNVWFIYIGKLPDIIEILIAAICLIVFCGTKLWLAYQSTFNDSIKTILRNCMIIGVGRFLYVLGMGLVELAAFVGAFFVFWIMAPMMALIPGVHLFLYAALSRKALKPFMPAAPSIEETESL